MLLIEQEPTPRPADRPDRWVGIVDDDASIRSSLARGLRMEGLCAETFASGEEFLERIDRGAPDCLVLDVHLGQFTGFDLQDQLASRGTGPPIIFITAYEEIPPSRLTPCGGSAGYLRKPFDIAALIALVRLYLR